MNLVLQICVEHILDYTVAGTIAVTVAAALIYYCTWKRVRKSPGSKFVALPLYIALIWSVVIADAHLRSQHEGRLAAALDEPPLPSAEFVTFISLRLR